MSGWKFKENDAHVERLTHSHQIEITWSRPKPDVISTRNDLIVYVLLSRDKSIRGHADWEERQQVSVNLVNNIHIIVESLFSCP